MSAGVKDIDHGYKNIRKMADKLRKNPYVEVGVLGSEALAKDEEGVTVVEYATYNEFGTSTIPERSFIRSTIDERRNRLFGKAFILQSEVLAGKMQVSQALRLLGELVKGSIQQKITNLRTPPNAPSTVKAKGSSNPLIDTGRLNSSISYEVNTGGGE